MSFVDKYTAFFNRFLPGPFTIAVILSLLTLFLAFFFSGKSDQSFSYFISLIDHWEKGLWDRPLLVFAYQMMLMLILGHTLALTKPVDRLISRSLIFCTNTPRAALFVTFFTVVISLFNWGLGLIFGAIFARKVAEHAIKQGFSLNYPLIGAAGYSGLMVWHGGISGSSTVKAAESDHLKEMMTGIYNSEQIMSLPVSIPFDLTVFSSMNLTVSALLITMLPLSMYLLARFSGHRSLEIMPKQLDNSIGKNIQGSDGLNYGRIAVYIFSMVILSAIVIRIFTGKSSAYFNFLTPDFINLSLLFLAIILHGNFHRFVDAVQEAIGGAAGILIQFPLYFGIMGIMKGSGMIEDLSDFFIAISNEYTFPLFTFFSAAIVNVFVPSGGGQWAIQGPIIIQTADLMNVPLNKGIMALAYGDQLTNMLQPFWALPLLGITGLKAKEILPYTLFLMLIGFVIFFSALLIF